MKTIVLSDGIQEIIKDALVVLAAIVGAVIASKSANKQEERKYKRQKDDERLKNSMIPYLDCLEFTQTQNCEIVSESNSKGINKLFNVLEQPLEYLQVPKRIYLSEKSQQLLYEYNDLIRNLKKQVEEDRKYFIKKYSEYIKDSFCYLDGKFMGDVSITINQVMLDKINISVLSHKAVTLIYDIDSVTFKDKYGDMTLQLSDEDREYYDNLCETNGSEKKFVQYKEDGFSKDSSYDTNEFKYEYELLCCIDKVHKCEEQEIIKIIENTKSSELLNQIREKLKDMRDEDNEEINKIVFPNF